MRARPCLSACVSIGVNYVAASFLFRDTAPGPCGIGAFHFGGCRLQRGGALSYFEKTDRGIYGRNLVESIWKIALASAVMGAAVLLSSHGIERWLGDHRLARLIDLAVSIPLGLMIFYAACRMLRVSELELAARALADPLARRDRNGLG